MPKEFSPGTEIEDEDPNELIQDAMEYLKKGDYINAIEYLEKAITINPRIALVYNTKGQALFNLKKYSNALTCYEKAIELQPKYIEALYNKGLTLAAIGNHDKAIQSFNQSIELNPNDDADIWNSKGLCFNALGQYYEAIECFDRALKLNPSHNEALNNNNKDIAISNLTKQQQQQEHQQQTQTRTSSSTDIGNTIAVGTKDPETVTKEIVEEDNKWKGEPIIGRDSSSSQPTEYASCPVKKKNNIRKSLMLR